MRIRCIQLLKGQELSLRRKTELDRIYMVDGKIAELLFSANAYLDFKTSGQNLVGLKSFRGLSKSLHLNT